MRSYRIPLGLHMSPSLYDIYRLLVFTMSITFLALGAIGLLLAASRDIPDRLLRRVAWLYAVWVTAFLVLSVAQQIPPPLISSVLIEVALLPSLFSRESKNPVAPQG